MRRSVSLASSVAMVTFSATTFVSAQDVSATYSMFGTPGLLEMPTAQSAPADALAATFGYTENYFRATLSFQITPRLSASYRYTLADIYGDPLGSGIDDTTERGFDLQYRFNDETKYLPAVAIGFRDFLTPGRIQSEYLVASKSVGDNLIVTAGLGWGQMGTRDGFSNLFGADTRPVFDENDPDGQLASDYWFRGDAALFGGLEYQINDKWGVKAEYSSIAYDEAANNLAIEADSPYNFGLTYRPRPGVQLGLNYLYGNQVGVSGSFELNPNNRPGKSGLETAPVPVKVRSNTRAPWDRGAVSETALRNAMDSLLKVEGLTLVGMEMTDTSARLRYINGRHRSQAQAMGRVARLMTQAMPPAIETFILEPEVDGIPAASVTILRSDMERLENRVGGSAELFERAQFGDAKRTAGLVEVERDENPFAWGLGPYFGINPFGGNGSASVEAGVQLRGVYKIQPNLVLSGAIRQSVVPPEDNDGPQDDGDGIQNVRTDGDLYGEDGIPFLQTLSLTHYSRPATDLYGRVSVGYLEEMFGGVSGEVLWKPVTSRLGLGAEVNYVAQRDTDMGFGFEEYDYDVVTGHLSAYYDLGSGYHTQLDVGRYLAGDWGATLSVDREFDNGWTVGAYVTQTDISYDDFGDGSYNKGVVVTIPEDFFTGVASRGSYDNTLRTRVGDGGARLSVNGRLYDEVRDTHAADLEDTWGRFWR